MLRALTGAIVSGRWVGPDPSGNIKGKNSLPLVRACACTTCACVTQTAGLESLQEELQVPNHRIPLSAKGVQESISAGQAVQQLLSDPPDAEQRNSSQNGRQVNSPSSSMQQGGKLFLYTSPFLRCIQTAQHITRALDDEQV
jgi:hypothetical protein